MSVLKPSPVKDILSNLIHPPIKLYLGLITLLRCHSNCPRISTLLVGQVRFEHTQPYKARSLQLPPALQLRR